MSKAIREWQFYMDDMIKFAENVIAYTEGFNQIDFVNSDLNYDATVRNLELIGEAATHIPDEIRQVNSAIPWRQIIATRNQLIHGYLGIDDDILWSVIETDIPALLKELELFQQKYNYTEVQRKLWQNESVESLSAKAQQAWDKNI